MHVFSHRGFSTSYPENTLQAFDTVLQEGYSLETDVRVTKDDKLVISHDANLRRTSGTDIEIARAKFRTIRQIGLLSDKHQNQAFRIPTLTETLRLFCEKAADDALLALHIKDTQHEEIEELVSDAISSVNSEYKQNLFEQLFVFGCTPENAKSFNDVNPNLHIGLIIGEEDYFPTSDHPTVYPYSDVASMDCWDIVWAAEWIGNLYTDEFFQRCQNEKRSVFCVSPELHSELVPSHPASDSHTDVWADLTTFEVDGICTHHPQELYDFLQQ